MKSKNASPIRKVQNSLDNDTPRAKVIFNLDSDFGTESKRTLLQMEMSNVKPFEDEMKNSSSPQKKILMNMREAKSNSSCFSESEKTQIDFDEGLFLLQRTFKLKTTDILKTLKVFFYDFELKNRFLRIKTTKAIRFYSKTI